MKYYIAGYPVSDELYHHGIQGQKWGIRRYQNPDGTLTAAGRARYSYDQSMRELGIEEKKNKWTTDVVEKRLVGQHMRYKNAEDRSWRRAAKAKSKGKDPSKYINKAKEFSKSADMVKKMGLNYKDLDKGTKRSMNMRLIGMQYAGQFLAGIPGNVLAYQLGETYLRDKLS